MLKSSKSPFNQITSVNAVANATYSVSVDDRVILVCFFVDQLTVNPKTWSRYPVIDLQSLSVAQLASTFGVVLPDLDYV